MRHPVPRQVSNASFNTVHALRESPCSIIDFPERKRSAVYQNGAFMRVAASTRRVDALLGGREIAGRGHDTAHAETEYPATSTNGWSVGPQLVEACLQPLASPGR